MASSDEVVFYVEVTVSLAAILINRKCEAVIILRWWLRDVSHFRAASRFPMLNTPECTPWLHPDGVSYSLKRKLRRYLFPGDLVLSMHLRSSNTSSTS